ncbi:hypothetical protein [uncultured Trichococcus sp.]|uniref:hypothetical protein n=1 Tax=uncultured Trichococcus sp. TaxID=189665 RepID=UPI002A18BB89|nr:hypothetical protein [uncultured Trichococcus sp.]
MKKSLYTIVNLIFGIVLISLVFIFLLGYSENVSKNTYIFGGILLMLGIAFNWYMFIRTVKKEGRHMENRRKKLGLLVTLCFALFIIFFSLFLNK